MIYNALILRFNFYLWADTPSARTRKNKLSKGTSSIVAYKLTYKSIVAPTAHWARLLSPISVCRRRWNSRPLERRRGAAAWRSKIQPVGRLIFSDSGGSAGDVRR